ncbi:unnamed protein product [Allacma fusca]|uniref:Uncharacterized protein n=1 Tax=Allacma fusca TaxID=39272 RepID=A0A8J2L742_9HEXA|nr:unnamed protein product [Allacma fusca]
MFISWESATSGFVACHLIFADLFWRLWPREQLGPYKQTEIKSRNILFNGVSQMKDRDNMKQKICVNTSYKYLQSSQTSEPPWRNWLARSAVNREVGGSSPPGGE